VNYKDKYLQLRTRFEESVEVAFRLGFEQGAQAAQQQQMQQQAQQVAQQQAQQAQLAAGGGMGQPGQPGQPGQGMEGPSEDPTQEGPPGAQVQDDSRGVGQQTGAAGAPQGMGGSQLDQHIGELEDVMSKSEYGSDQWEKLNKSINKLKAIKVTVDYNKNQDLIKSIGKNLNNPLKLSARANHNMSLSNKEALGLQHKIVNNLMDTWAKEEQGLPVSIVEILQSESLTKKD